jgi:hypothetical protein
MLLTYRVWACVHTQGADLINDLFASVLNAIKFVLLLIVGVHTIGIIVFVLGVLVYGTDPIAGMVLGAVGLVIALTTDVV